MVTVEVRALLPSLNAYVKEPVPVTPGVGVKMAPSESIVAAPLTKALTVDLIAAPVNTSFAKTGMNTARPSDVVAKSGFAICAKVELIWKAATRTARKWK